MYAVPSALLAAWTLFNSLSLSLSRGSLIQQARMLAAGVDGIKADFILDSADLLVTPLVLTFNQILDKGDPPSWCIGLIHPIYKAGDRDDPGNYRDITVVVILSTSIQPAWLMRTDLCSCLGHLQNGCEAMANSLLVLMPHEQTHGAFSILKQIGILSPDGTKARAVKNVMKLIANSLSVAKVAPTEMAGEAGPNKPALLNRQRM